VVVETGVFPFFKGFAMSQGKKGFYDVQKVFEGPHIGVGTVIFRSILDNVTGFKDPGKGFVGDTNDGVGFSIFKVDVVSGTVLFYQGVFQEQGFVFIGNHNGFYAGKMRKEGSRFNILGAIEI